MKSPRQLIGYRWLKCNDRGSCGDRYCDLQIEFLFGHEADAAREYDHNPTEYYLERLQRIRKAGTSAKYFEADYPRENLTLRWLSSKESYDKYQSKWFACRLENGAINGATLKLLTALYKAGIGYDSTPEDLQAVLDKLGALQVTYIGDMSFSWTFTTEPQDFALPWEPAEEPEPVTT